MRNHRKNQPLPSGRYIAGILNYYQSFPDFVNP